METNEKKTAYISGKITGLADKNKPKFAAAEALLVSKGYKVINPHVICADIPEDAPWEVFMRRCIKHLPDSDEIFVLDDWYKSNGAWVEVKMAITLKIPVKEIETFEVL